MDIKSVAASNSIGIVYDAHMTKHEHKEKHVETPKRIQVPYQMIQESGLMNDCSIIPARAGTLAELKLVHKDSYIQDVKSYNSKMAQNVCKLQEKWPTYISDYAFESATWAVGSAINLVDAVLTGKVTSGIALTRPPGHHAEADESCGFCFFNTVAIAAKHAQAKYKVSKILILDWDIHHGNGIQHAFYEDPEVLYISIHRFDNGEYFPNLKDASHDMVGSGKGEGFNVNIPWNKDMMGNSEYKAAFDRIVVPIIKQFDPELIFVAAGFDAAAADPLGDYILTPDMYAFMTEKLRHFAGGRVVLFLEGGYNEVTIGESLVQCMQVLLGQKSTVKLKDIQEPCKRAMQTISSVIMSQSPYWNL